MNDDMDKYKDAYLSEARNHVKDMNLALIQWEKRPRNKTCLKDIFRMAHTLKGISATMGYQHITELSHAIEDLLDAIRNEAVTLNDCSDLLFTCFDFLENSLKALSEEQTELDSEPFIQKIRNLLSHDSAPTEELTANVNLNIETLSTIEVKVERLDKLLNLTKELLVNKMKLETLSETIQAQELTATVDIVNRNISELQYHVMQIRLVPMGFVFDRFIRLVRDLAKQQKKEVNLQTEGGDIELDRSLIDSIGEALTHLIKNAIDHGLESPKARLAAQKDPMGEIKLTAARKKESLIIEVADDGAGLDLPAIKLQAMQSHLLPRSPKEEEITNSIFSGISTSKKITAVSGRGLGLSIVKRKIESINGTIEVITERGKGTTFIVKIPLTLAVIFVLLVKQGEQTYAIPLNSVERLMRISSFDVKGLLNDEAIIYNNTSIPVMRLSRLFNTESSLNVERYSMIILRKEKKLLGLIVDTLLTTEEIITQPINMMIKGSNLFSGTALLGSGETILILDVEQLFQANASLKKEEDAKI